MKPKDSENVLSGAPGYNETDQPTTFLLLSETEKKMEREMDSTSFPTIGLWWKESKVRGSSRSTSVRN